MKNRCQNGTQKIMKWTKNATKINKKVEGEEERRGRGAERRGEERRARARTRKEKKGGPFWRRGDFWANQRWEGEVYPTLKGGTSWHPARPSFGWLGPPRDHFCLDPIFRIRFTLIFNGLSFPFGLVLIDFPCFLHSFVEHEFGIDFVSILGWVLLSFLMCF